VAVRWARALAILAATVMFVAWAFRALAERPRRAVADLGGVGDLASIAKPSWAPGLTIVVASLVIAALLRHRTLVERGGLAAFACLGTAAAVFVSMALPLGHFALLTGLAIIAALSVALLGPEPYAPQTRSDPRKALVLWIAVTATMGIFSIHRNNAYGSGSWDMGCMVHNFYRASRFIGTTSTVLGDVDFLGDHFMLGIWLYAPIMWISSSGTTLLLIQSANLAAAAPAVFLIARHRGAPLSGALAIGVVTGLAFGLQSAAYFDSHEITVGFGWLAWGIWALETGRLRLATVLLFAFATFKESLGAYWVALGLLAIWRGVRGRERRLWRFGAAWVALGGAWFVLVNRVFMPALRASAANAPEPHETFGDFGPTVFTAAVGIVSDPVRALAALFVPDEKLHSQLVTLAGSGWLPFTGPDVWLAALPLAAERFLSSKSTMWEMGYHYAAPLSLYAGWATAVGWSRAEAWTRSALEAAGGIGRFAPRFLALYLIAMAALTNSIGYRHPGNFHRWDEGYFSPPERRKQHDGAVALLEAQGRDARIAAQNRLLPHVANRPVIYRIGEWQKTDWVLLSVGESAWPYDDGMPQRLSQELGKNPEWRLVYAAGQTLVYARAKASDLPPVSH